ncbi:MFS transporter [Rouxiella badensis]|uniref:MFS transporter n=1 Tax=Rouxiella badensis TaxID=1646377 RepID=UPI001D13DADA|nr:MFS transporter [Rouxiella badensis]MCC3720004.1 MFS transporter [Rouxiella badensis]MCC3729667.1 MFS transporter [Rouxiella badensis]MCC3731450.1 MFS transporter [Rouxiella badensis]MCC3738385.1 MFS transporter [Rouxiella badensis]MCC3756839.1 MFS transporter [Rouxiella badensis]
MEITAQPKVSPAAATFNLRIMTGLVGILLASLIAGLNEHVTDIAMPDVQGAMSISHDEGSWLTTLYEATQVAAMAFAPWFSATLSLRRFTLSVTAAFMLLGVLCPFASNLHQLYLLRALQGLFGGCLPPMLMSVALRFLPPGIKLYGLGAYALTATFGPNLGTPLAVLWTEYVGWRWAFWQVVPVCLLAMSAVYWGIPQDPLRLERFRQFNWRGVLLGFPAIASLVIVLEQGTRLGWLDSPFIGRMLALGLVSMTLFMVNEWFHPLPFFKVQQLARRNLTFSLITLGGVLVILVAVPGIPAAYLAEVQGYRPLQIAPLALYVALGQLLALPLVSSLCNLNRVDCRWVLAVGLGLIALTCYLGSAMTSDWIRNNFYGLQMLQILAQPMAVIPLLMLATNGLPPIEGPSASAWFNTVKGMAAVVGTGVLEGVTTMREHFHSHTLVDRLGGRSLWLAQQHEGLTRLAGQIRAQALVLASADLYRMMAFITLTLIIFIPLMATRVYPPRPVKDA